MSEQEINNGLRWYVIHTYSGYENKVKKDLENTIKNARTIENLHELIKNNGKSFELSDEEMQLAELLG